MSWPLLIPLIWAAALIAIVVWVELARRAHARRLRSRRRAFVRHADGYARIGSRYGRLYVYREDGEP
jgi:hypothetical protein